MATYDIIENDRKQHEYVTYDFNLIDPRLPNEYNPDQVWCRYMVDSPSGDPNKSRKAIIQKKYREYDLYSDEQNQQFRRLQAVLESRGCSNMIPYFNKFCSLNVRDDDTCQLMIMAGAKINYDAIIRDINSIPKGSEKKEISKILHRLTGQANCAALNGAFTKVFCATLNHAGNNYENEIAQFYKKLIKGNPHSKQPADAPIDIPTDPSIPFITALKMAKSASSADSDPNFNARYFLREIMKDSTQNRALQARFTSGNGKRPN